MTVEIFKTNVTSHQDAGSLVSKLCMLFPGSRINFDLHDCDHILRVEAKIVHIDQIISALTEKGFSCEVLT